MIRKLFAIIVFVFFSVATFAQTKKIAEKKLVKTLENNKKTDIVFVSEINLQGVRIETDGHIELPIFNQSSVSLFADIDTTFLKERIEHTKRQVFKVTIATKNIDEKSYRLTDIEGIETVAEYKVRLENERKENIVKQLVQVVSPTLENITGSEQNWLGGQIQDKLKSNLQDYLGMKIVVDAKSESALKKLQQESESESHDENTAIEIGKITTAKFALFTSIRKTNKGYSISADFTDLTTGEQFANAVTKEYIKSEYLYGSTGAIDELTILLADKLGIKISDVQRTALQDGTGDLTIDAQLALARQNEQQYKRLMSQYDAQLRKLSTSTDLNAEENKRKIEAEKALLAEKQKSEEKRRIELENQKRQVKADSELEAQRSIELKTRRDELAKQAEAKAKEIRQLAIKKQGVLGEINLIESKKKALVEIRQSAEHRCIELHKQYIADKQLEEEKIKNKPYTSVELENGKPTQSALQRRENQIIASNDALYNKFIADTETVKKAIAPQESALLAEIRADQKNLEKTRTVSSLGEELRIGYGEFSGENKGWNAYISLYSEGVLLYNGAFILSYEPVVGKKAPNLATELNDTVVNDYSNNVDMYNSLLARGTPLFQFELDYSVKAETDDKPSEYVFDFNTIRTISSIDGKIAQTNNLNVSIARKIKPEWDLRKFEGIPEIFNKKKVYFVQIKNKNYEIQTTEVPQWLYTYVMGENPSYFKGDNLPVEQVSWFDAIYFCNLLSEKKGYSPVYSVKGITDVKKWNYIPHKGNKIIGEIKSNFQRNGFRLPTFDEWEYAAQGKNKWEFSESDIILNDTDWIEKNSNKKTHPIASKKSNDSGLYDIKGNVAEWCWDNRWSDYSKYKTITGGSWLSVPTYNNSPVSGGLEAEKSHGSIGFRIVRTVIE